MAELARKLGGGGKNAKKAFAKARRDAARLKDELERSTKSLHEMRRALGEAGVSTNDLVSHQRKLKASLAEVEKEYEGLARVAKARDTLDLRAHKDVVSEIERMRR